MFFPYWWNRGSAYKVLVQRTRKRPEGVRTLLDRRGWGIVDWKEEGKRAIRKEGGALLEEGSAIRGEGRKTEAWQGLHGRPSCLRREGLCRQCGGWGDRRTEYHGLIRWPQWRRRAGTVCRRTE